jgi:hypothetical protein
MTALVGGEVLADLLPVGDSGVLVYDTAVDDVVIGGDHIGEELWGHLHADGIRRIVQSTNYGGLHFRDLRHGPQ